jgi:hypothetical protein
MKQDFFATSVLIFLLAGLQGTSLHAQGIPLGDYVRETLYNIPWGNEPGTLSNAFTRHDVAVVIYPPGPFVFTDDGVLYVVNNGDPGNCVLMRFSTDGEMESYVTFESMGFQNLYNLYIFLEISGSGDIIAAWDDKVVILTPLLDILYEVNVPGSVNSIYRDWLSPSDCVFIKYLVMNNSDNSRHEYLVDLSMDGILGDPEELTVVHNHALNLPINLRGRIPDTDGCIWSRRYTGEPFPDQIDKIDANGNVVYTLDMYEIVLDTLGGRISANESTYAALRRFYFQDDGDVYYVCGSMDGLNIGRLRLLR